MTAPTLHLFCGKIGSGKSTLAAALARAPNTVLIAEDDWISTLYGDDITSFADYVRFAYRLRRIMGPHVAALLNAGVSVALDAPANTVETRAWMRSVLKQTTAAHQLHVLQTSEALCLQRLRQRNAAGGHPFRVTDAQFHQITAYFEPPTRQEGFTLIPEA